MISLTAISIYLFFTLIAVGLLASRISRSLRNQWWIAIVRASLQLSLLGLVLTPILKNDNWLILLALLMILNVTASFVTIERTRKKHKIYVPVFVSLFLGTLLFGLAVFLTTSPDSQFKTQFIFPFMGVLLSNSISGLSLAIKSMFQFIEIKKEEIEGYVLLGVEPNQLLKKYLPDLMDLALTPSLNAMASAGLVGVPGVMAGTLIAGQSFQNAVISQVHIFLTLSLSVFLSTTLCLFLICKKLKLFAGVVKPLDARGLND